MIALAFKKENKSITRMKNNLLKLDFKNNFLSLCEWDMNCHEPNIYIFKISLYTNKYFFFQYKYVIISSTNIFALEYLIKNIIL